MEVNKFKRGQIWWYNNNGPYDGSIQGKRRPVIIISNNKANTFSNTLIVVPCTTKIKNMYLKTHIQFKIDNEDNVALCENLMSANTIKFEEYIGTCDDELLKEVENGVKIALGLIDFTTKKQTVEIINIAENVQNDTKDDEKVIVNSSNILISEPKRGRKCTYTEDYKIRFVNDYETHNAEYMLKKYGLKDVKALTNKLYTFRKSINKES